MYALRTRARFIKDGGHQCKGSIEMMASGGSSGSIINQLDSLIAIGSKTKGIFIRRAMAGFMVSALWLRPDY